MTRRPSDALPILSSFAPAFTPARLMQVLLRWFPDRSFRQASDAGFGRSAT